MLELEVAETISRHSEHDIMKIFVVPISSPEMHQHQDRLVLDKMLTGQVRCRFYRLRGETGFDYQF